MQIYVVRPGDSIWKISRLYGVSPDSIIKANQLDSPNQLVVGQALVIPTNVQYHIVRRGESLFTISRMHGITINELVAANGGITPNRLVPGMRLVIPPPKKMTIRTGAFIDIAEARERAAQIVNEVAPLLTFIEPFTYTINPDGSLNQINDAAIIDVAKRNRVMPIMVVANFAQGTFNIEIVTAVLSSEAAQDKLLNEILATMRSKGYGGVLFDFEYVGGENRERYNAFIRKASDFLRPKGFQLASALAPKISDTEVGRLYEGHDYRVHGEAVDNVYLMTYEWGWSGGPPMAVAPINEVRKVLNYAVTKIPNKKIMMGMPLYGYDWTLPYVRGGKFARRISPLNAVKLAYEKGAVIHFDPESQSPYFYYYDQDGKQHVVWFEDARSAQAKFNLVKAYNLGGLFYWVLGSEFPQNWELLNYNFDIQKLV